VVGTTDDTRSTVRRHWVKATLRFVARRRWWIVGCTIVVAAAAAALALRHPAMYRASALVLLNPDVPGQIGQSGAQDPERFARTQATEARTTAVAVRVIAAAKLSTTTHDFLAHSGVRLLPDQNVLEFSARNHHPDVAKALATTYASQALIHSHLLERSRLLRAQTAVERQMAALRATGDTGSAAYQALAADDAALRTAEALPTGTVIQVAETAKKVQPRPVRDGLLGLALGVVLGLGFGGLREALDTRIRSAEEIADRLGLPLLGRLVEPPRRLQAADRLVTIDDPSGALADEFRVLRTNLAFANYERGARSIMVTSAIAREGKSTTAANLAVALARAGSKVALVDLDLRRPYLGRFFGLDNSPGLTDVALGHVPLSEAVTQLRLTAQTGPGQNGRASESGEAPVTLRILRAGSVPPDPGEVVGWPVVGKIIEQLASELDYVLVDTPPMLGVGDAVTLGDKVDAVLVVARSSVIKRPALDELRRQLDALPMLKLGFVMTQADSEEGYGEAHGYGRYGYSYHLAASRQRAGALPPEQVRTTR